MQKAVDIVGTSTHPANKIAATLFGSDFSISRTNYWPDTIAERIGTHVKIGGSSGTIHAETACIMASTYPTESASLCITDPFCPNCAKNIAEAGIKTIYIDHKGFTKDFAERRGDDFENMSMRICTKAGITIYELHRKEQKLIPIFEAPENYHAYDENPVEMESLNSADDVTFMTLIHDKTTGTEKRKRAIAITRDPKDRVFALSATTHPAIGYSSDQDLDEIKQEQGKYSYMTEPVNRVLMNAARRGLKIVNGLLYCSQVPTAREQVNIVGAGLKTIVIGDLSKARDDQSLEAMRFLNTNEVLSYRPLAGG